MVLNCTATPSIKGNSNESTENEKVGSMENKKNWSKRYGEESKRKVQNRLLLIVDLVEYIEVLRVRESPQTDGDGTWTHLAILYEELVNYLILTCFDVLGSENGLPFGNWLNSKQSIHKNERDEVLKNVAKGASHHEAAKALVEKHRLLHGVKVGFYRFIAELDDSQREELLQSVTVHSVVKQGKRNEDGTLTSGLTGAAIDEAEIKKKILFGIRNRFTHSADGAGSAWTSLMPRFVILNKQGIKAGGEPVTRARIFGQNYQVDFRMWPFVPFKILREIIGCEMVPLPKVYLDTAIEVKGKLFSSTEPLPLEEFENPQKLFKKLLRHLEDSF